MDWLNAGWIKTKKQMVVTIGRNAYKVVEIKRTELGDKLHLNRVVNGEVVPYAHRFCYIDDVCTVFVDGVVRYKVQLENGKYGFIAAGDIK